MKILEENKDKLIQLAEALEEKEILGREEIEKIIGKKISPKATLKDESQNIDRKG